MKIRKEINMGLKITYFVHGTTTDNEANKCTGWNHGELSERGIRQVKELSKLIENKEFDIVFCSDLKRAIVSANLAFKDVYEIRMDSRLREADYGDLNGLPETEFNEDQTAYIDNPFPNGECFKDVENRLTGFLDFLRDNFTDKHVAIVSHKAPQLALEVLLKNRTWKQAIEEDWRKRKEWQPGWEYEV